MLEWKTKIRAKKPQKTNKRDNDMQTWNACYWETIDRKRKCLLTWSYLLSDMFFVHSVIKAFHVNVLTLNENSWSKTYLPNAIYGKRTYKYFMKENNQKVFHFNHPICSISVLQNITQNAFMVQAKVFVNW